MSSNELLSADAGEASNSDFPSDILSEMPDFQEHMQRLKAEKAARAEFVADDYDAPIGQKDAISNIHFKLDNLPSNFGQKNQEYVNLYMTRIKVLEGECSPKAIAERYGDVIEGAGTSLKAMNFIISRYMPAEISINNKGTRYSAYDNQPEPYEYFYTELPSVIEKHFSDTILDADKKDFSNVINKIYNSWNNTDTVAESENELSDREEELLSRYYADALKESGYSFEQAKGGVLTKDAAMDGIIGLLKESSRDSMSSPYELRLYGKIMKKVEEQMVNN